VAAQNAAFTLDGVSYTRRTNTITDALSGVTINLVKADAAHQSISVDKGEDQAPQVMQGLVDAFNDLVITAKKLSVRASTANGVKTDGSLAGSPTALNFLNQIKSMLNGDIHYTLAGNPGTISMGELGFEMQYDGTAKFNATTFKEVSNASAILASGIKVGYQTYVVRDPETGAEISKNTTNVTLNSYLTSLLKVTTSTTDAGTQTLAGAFDQMIKNEQSNIEGMNKKERALQLQLDQKQRSYIRQYSALNELLFKLSNTSNSLTNALSGLTNGQNNK
jgi:flagellar hook-associated protein 2